MYMAGALKVSNCRNKAGGGECEGIIASYDIDIAYRSDATWELLTIKVVSLSRDASELKGESKTNIGWVSVSYFNSSK